MLDMYLSIFWHPKGRNLWTYYTRSLAIALIVLALLMAFAGLSATGLLKMLGIMVAQEIICATWARKRFGDVPPARSMIDHGNKGG